MRFGCSFCTKNLHSGLVFWGKMKFRVSVNGNKGKGERQREGGGESNN